MPVFKNNEDVASDVPYKIAISYSTLRLLPKTEIEKFKEILDLFNGENVFVFEPRRRKGAEKIQELEELRNQFKFTQGVLLYGTNGRELHEFNKYGITHVVTTSAKQIDRVLVYGTIKRQCYLMA